MATSSKHLEDAPRRWTPYQSGRVRLIIGQCPWNADAGTVELFRWVVSTRRAGKWEKAYWFTENDLSRIHSCVKRAAKECGVAIDNECWTELVMKSRDLLFACSCGGVKGKVVGPRIGWRYRQIDFTSESKPIGEPRLFLVHELGDLASRVMYPSGWQASARCCL